VEKPQSETYISTVSLLKAKDLCNGLLLKINQIDNSTEAIGM